MDIYKECPIYENQRISLVQTTMEDAEELLKCYPDEKAVELFNSDNCNGDKFHYTTLEKMKQAMATASERIVALQEKGYRPINKKLMKIYDDYFVSKRGVYNE